MASRATQGELRTAGRAARVDQLLASQVRRCHHHAQLLPALSLLRLNHSPQRRRSRHERDVADGGEERPAIAALERETTRADAGRWPTRERGAK